MFKTKQQIFLGLNKWLNNILVKQCNLFTFVSAFFEMQNNVFITVLIFQNFYV